MKLSINARQSTWIDLPIQFRHKSHFWNWLRSLPQIHGQGLPEYALIIALVAIVVVAIAALMGSAIRQAFCEPLIALNPEYASSCIQAPVPPSSPEEEAGAISSLAVYSSSRGNLYIAARVPDGSSATLTVVGYGDMQYVPKKDAFVLVIPISDPPSSVTITSSEGPSVTIEVTRYG